MFRYNIMDDLSRGRRGNSSLRMSSKLRGRPLGSVRQSISDDIKFPPLVKTTHEPEARTGELNGISGNAMAVPPPRVYPSPRKSAVVETRPERKRVTPRFVPTKRPKSDHSSSGKSEDSDAHKAPPPKVENKEDPRIKELLKRIAELERLVAQLEGQVKDKDCKVADLEARLEEEANSHRKLLASERKNREELELHFRHSREKAAELERKLDELNAEYSTQIDELKIQHTHEMEALRREKDRDIAERDEKLKRLKLQMADALKGNSQERQLQLDELSKELNRLQDECDTLRMKLKAATKGKGAGNCGNCKEMEGKLVRSNDLLIESQLQNKQLNEVCQKFGKQLKQQDILLKTWADSKGYKSK